MAKKEVKKSRRKVESRRTPLPDSSKPSFLDRITVRLSHSDILMFTKYLSVLLHSGLAIDDALSVILDQSKKGPLKKIVGVLSKTIKSGKTIATGFAKFPQVFSPVYVNLIAAGEASGTLQKNLNYLTVQIQKEHELRSKIRGALMYPAVIMSAAVLLSIGIVVFILPNILDVFNTLDVELPWTTKVLIWVANLFDLHGLLVTLGIIAAAGLFMFVRSIKALKPYTHRLLLYIPIVGSIMRDTNLARFARVTGTMLNSGSRIANVLPISTSVLKNARYQLLLTEMTGEIKSGGSIAVYMEGHKREFSQIMLRMTRVGEESGTLGDMMIYLAEFYEQELDDSMRNLSNMLEPILLIGIGILVGTLALSIIAPIYSVVGNI